MSLGFSLPRCFSSASRSPRPTASIDIFLDNYARSVHVQQEQIQEAKEALQQAKMAHNQMVLGLVAKGFSAHYISDKSCRDWSDTVSILRSLYSSSTISTACFELGINS